MRASLNRLVDLCRLDADNPTLLCAQRRSLEQQVPLLYLIVLFNIAASVYTYYPYGSTLQTVYAPLLMCAVMAFRVNWWLKQKNAPLTGASALRDLQSASLVLVSFTIAFSIWALSLLRLNEAAHNRTPIVVFLSFSLIASLLCLRNLRFAAIWMTVIVDVCLVVFLFLDDDRNLRVTIISILVTSVVALAIALSSYHEFVRLVDQRAKASGTPSNPLQTVENPEELMEVSPYLRWLTARAAHARATNTRIALALVDLDMFKSVIDTYGIDIGERILAAVAERLASVGAPHVTVFRFDADQFGVVLEGDPSDEELAGRMRRLVNAFAEPLTADDIHIMISATIGYATFPDQAEDPLFLHERADYALHRAKRQKRGQALRFTHEHQEFIRLDRIAKAMQLADLQKELLVFYQPIVEARTGRAVAFEALARWKCPVLGFVSPVDFIRIAERTGFIRLMTKVLFEKALAAMRNWPEEIRLSFNLSAQDLASSEAVNGLIRAIAESGIDPHRIDFEITETALTMDAEQAERLTFQLSSIGVGSRSTTSALGFPASITSARCGLASSKSTEASSAIFATTIRIFSWSRRSNRYAMVCKSAA